MRILVSALLLHAYTASYATRVRGCTAQYLVINYEFSDDLYAEAETLQQRAERRRGAEAAAAYEQAAVSAPASLQACPPTLQSDKSDKNWYIPISS